MENYSNEKWKMSDNVGHEHIKRRETYKKTRDTQAKHNESESTK